MSEISIAHESPNQPEILHLLAKSDAYYAALYPTESNHLFDIATLQKPHVAFYVARMKTAVCGFAAIVDCTEYAELKRMYIDEPYRKRGLGKQLLSALEAHTRNLGNSVVRLETGIRQPEAIGLYPKAGYRETLPFGTYTDDQLSVFMEKQL